METIEVLQKLDVAIATLLENESDSLQRGLNELNVSTHLAFYLKPLFNNYNVDPEYNGDIDKPNDRKALDIAKNRIREVGKKTNDFDNYKLSPDIIIHQRGTNDSNLAVIEVKKDIHSKNVKDFDLIKLEHLTIDFLGNHYNYKVGVAVIFGTGQNAGTYEMKFYQMGLPKQRLDLS